jgi:hypothetical protein
MDKKYFFINSNICFPGDDLNFDKFMHDISGNTGNSYITYSIIKILYGSFQRVDDIKNLWFYQSSQRDIDRINNEYSKVILVLQDNLRLTDSYLSHNIYKGLADFFKKIKIPIVVFSLGSNSFNDDCNIIHTKLNRGFIELLKVISDKTVSFGVRGNTTLEILNNLNITNAEAVGCPSYFETGRNRIIQKPSLKSDFKILSGGYLDNENTRDIQYVLQDEKLFIKAAAFPNERLLSDDFNNLSLNDKYRNVILDAYLENKIAVFSNMEEWKEFDKGFDFYVGARVHGAIMAINAGLPAIITRQDTRAKEMSDLFAIPYRTDIDKYYDLRKAYEEMDIEAMNNKYNPLYDNFVTWLKKNDLEPEVQCENKISCTDEKINKSISAQQGYLINPDVLRGHIEAREKYKPNKFAKTISRWLSLLVIGKENRKKVRKWIMEKLTKS